MSSALDQLPPIDDLIFSYKDLDQLLDPKLLAEYGLKVCKRKGCAFCKHVFGAWASALQSLPPDEANSFEKPFGKTVLNRCIVLLQALEETDYIVHGLLRAENPNADCLLDSQFLIDTCGCWPGLFLQDFLHETCASATIELVKHKLLPQTVEETFRFRREAVKQDLWKLVKGKCPRRNCRNCPGGLPPGLGADLMMALIDKGLPRWCWSGCLGPFNDNLLQYTLEPATVHFYDEKEEAEGLLCMFLAERLSLAELCHQNQDRRNALSYAEEFADGAGGNHPGGLGIKVREVIKQQMEVKVRELQGSGLHQLVELTRSVRAGLGGNLVLFELIFRSFQI